MNADNPTAPAQKTQRTKPQLQTERLLLRLATQTDVPAILTHFRSNETHFAPTDPLKPPQFYTEEFWKERVAQAEDEFDAEAAVRFIILDRANNEEVLGTINFTNIVRGAFQACYLGYGIGAKAQGKGLMTEAVKAAIGYAFGELNLHRIMANHLPDNARSAKLLAGLGFAVEGHARAYLFINGAWRDHTLNSLLNPEWKAR